MFIIIYYFIYMNIFYDFLCKGQYCAVMLFYFYFANNIVSVLYHWVFSGSIPSKALTFLKHMGVAAISDYTFFAHQRALLQPAVQAEWTSWQAKYVHTVKESGEC